MKDKRHRFKHIKNKDAFQWDAYRPLVDRIPACTEGGVCPGVASQHVMGQTPSYGQTPVKT